LGQPAKAREAFGQNLSASWANRISMLETGRAPLPSGAVPANPNGQYLYASGQALLGRGKNVEAVAEFQKILDNKLRYWGPFYGLAYLGVARAEARAGHAVQAKKAYEDFLTQWKAAESNVPVLLEARKEYKALDAHAGVHP